MKLQPDYAAWDAARARQGQFHPLAPSQAPVNSASRRQNNTISSHNEGQGGLGTQTPPTSSLPSRPGAGETPQRAGAASATSGANSATFPQNAGANPKPAHDNILRHFISSLDPDDPSVNWVNTGVLDILSRLERDGRPLELRAFTSQTAMALNDILRSLFKDCVKKTFTIARRFNHEKRACDT